MNIGIRSSIHPPTEGFWSPILVMAFKRQRRANTAMPMFLTGSKTEMFVWKYGWKLIILCKSRAYIWKLSKHSKSDVIGKCQNIGQWYLPSLWYWPAKKQQQIDIAQAITMVRTSWRATQSVMWFVDVFFTDCGMWCNWELCVLREGSLIYLLGNLTFCILNHCMRGSRFSWISLVL